MRHSPENEIDFKATVECPDLRGAGRDGVPRLHLLQPGRRHV